MGAISRKYRFPQEEKRRCDSPKAPTAPGRGKIWSRQDREARKLLGEQINTRRSGRAADKSIVSGREIEHQRGDDE